MTYYPPFQELHKEHAKLDIDNSKLLSGESTTVFLFGRLKVSGDNRFADAYFDGDAGTREKQAALYKALESKMGYDVIVNPKYVVTIKKGLLSKKITAVVTGYGGKIILKTNNRAAPAFTINETNIPSKKKPTRIVNNPAKGTNLILDQQKMTNERVIVSEVKVGDILYFTDPNSKKIKGEVTQLIDETNFELKYSAEMGVIKTTKLHARYLSILANGEFIPVDY